MAITLDMFIKKVEGYKLDQVKHVKKALQAGAKEVVKEMRTKLTTSGIQRRSGRLYRSIKQLELSVNPMTGAVVAKVGVGVVNGKSQWYKAVTHELGATRTHPGGIPWFMTSNGPRSVRKAFLEKHPWLPVTKPHVFTVPARPFVEPTRQSNVTAKVRDMIQRAMIRGWKDA